MINYLKRATTTSPKETIMNYREPKVGESAVMVHAGGWSYHPYNNKCVALIEKVEGGWVVLSEVWRIGGKVLHPKSKERQYDTFDSVPIEAYGQVVCRKAEPHEIPKTIPKTFKVGSWYKNPMLSDVYRSSFNALYWRVSKADHEVYKPTVDFVFDAYISDDGILVEKRTTQCNDNFDRKMEEVPFSTIEPYLKKPTADFKVKDWVVITKSKTNWTESMDSYIGKVVQITGFYNPDKIQFDGCGRWSWLYGDGHFRKARPDEIPNKNEELIAEAKRMYPVGTYFYPAHVVNAKKEVDYCIITDDTVFEISGLWVIATVHGVNWDSSPKYGNTCYNRTIYTGEKWAEIKETAKSVGKAIHEKIEIEIKESKYFIPEWGDTKADYEWFHRPEDELKENDSKYIFAPSTLYCSFLNFVKWL